MAPYPYFTIIDINTFWIFKKFTGLSVNPILWRREQAYEKEIYIYTNSDQAVESKAHVNGYECQGLQPLALLTNIPAEAYSVPLSFPFPILLSLFMAV